MTRSGPALLCSSDGFTLTEVMVAILIMMVGMVGLLQAIGIAYEHNLRNQVREEAVFVGEKCMNDLRSSYSFAPFATYSVAGSVRGTGKKYYVDRSATSISADNNTARLQVTVRWVYKNVSYQNRVVSVVSQSP